MCINDIHEDGWEYYNHSSLPFNAEIACTFASLFRLTSLLQFTFKEYKLYLKLWLLTL